MNEADAGAHGNAVQGKGDASADWQLRVPQSDDAAVRVSPRLIAGAKAIREADPAVPESRRPGAAPLPPDTGTGTCAGRSCRNVPSI